MKNNNDTNKNKLGYYSYIDYSKDNHSELNRLLSGDRNAEQTISISQEKRSKKWLKEFNN